MEDLEGDPVEYEQDMDIDERLGIMSQANADFVYWSSMPSWSLDEGIALLLGKDPTMVKWETIRPYVNYYYSSELCVEYSKLRTLVLRAFKANELGGSNTPIVFLKWVASKRINIPEALQQVTAVIENSESIASSELVKIQAQEINKLKEKCQLLEKRITELEHVYWDGFDEQKETYSKELAIAVKAHDAVSKTWNKGHSIKKQIFEWLEKNHPTLFNEEKERIAKICNWQKSGGAPITP